MGDRPPGVVGFFFKKCVPSTWCVQATRLSKVLFPLPPLFLLMQFCVLTVLALGMYVCSGGWSLREKARLPGELRGQLQSTLQEYDTVQAYAKVWDVVHRRVRYVKTRGPC